MGQRVLPLPLSYRVLVLTRQVGESVFGKKRRRSEIGHAPAGEEPRTWRWSGLSLVLAATDTLPELALKIPRVLVVAEPISGPLS